MENEVIQLVSRTFTVNGLGDSIATETNRDVFAKVQSVGFKRKMEAMTAGLKLELKFTLADDLEYQGEEILIYNSVRYNVVSVFITDNHEIELLTARQ